MMYCVKLSGEDLSRYPVGLRKCLYYHHPKKVMSRRHGNKRFSELVPRRGGKAAGVKKLRYCKPMYNHGVALDVIANRCGV